MLSRRQLLELGAVAAGLPIACCRGERSSGPVVLNDIHSKLNATQVDGIARPADLDSLVSLIRDSGIEGRAISISGGRHSMGGQQFGTDTLNLDIRDLNRVLSFDPQGGTVEVESGNEWPELIEWCGDHQEGVSPGWGIRQKQTGADRLTLGGALASNVHGRGLTLQPIVGDIESLTLVDAAGEVHRCSRHENRELFSMVVGGYGLFGVVYSLVLRLAPRQKIERVVEVRSIEDLARAFEERIAEGYLFGDFQFKTDESAQDYLNRGVFSCYRPLPDDAPIPKRQRRLPRAAWRRLLELAHYDKARAFEEYVSYYLSSSGQIYWSDTHQLSYYLDDYHELLDKKAGLRSTATEMISEVYVPRNRLTEFMGRAAEEFRRSDVNVIYGTIRLIERDDLTFLPWARESWACIVINLHVEHSPEGIEKAKDQFRLLIDLALEQGGSYFLTYHRWATREQVETCYPEMPELLRRKLQWDPEERFQSDWYRHYRQMFATDL
jgi:FAD/FMN-containing dehydrogenase